MDAVTFGEWVKSRRKALRLTQHQLSQSVYCSIELVRKIESDERRPSPLMAERFADSLAVSGVERAVFVRAARGLSPPSRLSAAATPGAVGPWADDLDAGALPLPATPLVGRERDVADVRGLVQQSTVRLVSLTGPPGVGKTRLAIQVAAELQHEFVDGVYFVPLAALRETDLILPRVAQTLRVLAGQGEPALARLAARFQGRRILLVLDNLEQLLTAASSLAALLMAAPSVKLLVTSRSSLHLSGEQRFVVRPLAAPDARAASTMPDLETAIARFPAVELFVERTHAAGSSLSRDEASVHALTTLCARLDGLPLALELAAARMPIFTPQELLARLDERFVLLTDGASDLPARQQTLLHALDWSYELLEAGRQKLLARLAVFHGGFTLEAIEATCRDDAAPQANLVSDLAALVDSSLVRREAGPGGTIRFGMLEIIREYALQRFHASGERDVLRERHARYFLSLIEQAEQHWDSLDERAWHEKLSAELDNVRAVLRWAIDGQQTAFCFRLNAALFSYWIYVADLAEARHWLEATLALPQPSPAPGVRADEAKLRNGLGYALATLGDPAAALTQFECATVLYQQGTDQRMTAWSLRGCGFVHMVRGEIARAKDLVEQSLAMAREAHDEWGVAWSLFDLGHLVMHEGDLAGAQPLLREGMVRCRAQGIMFGQFRALIALGFVLLQGHDPDGAHALYREGLALARDLHFRIYVPDGLEGLARVALARGQPVRAVTLFAAGEAVRTTTGLNRWPFLQATHAQCLADLHAQLDADTWQLAWSEGAHLSAAEAVLYAFRT